MNQRLVEIRPDFKEYRKNYEKIVHRNTPPSRKSLKRKEYDAERLRTKKELDQMIVKIYREILQDSFSTPILLRLEKGYSRLSDWRYCLYQGNVYQFDRADYSDQEMMDQISAAFAGKMPAS